MTKKLLFTLLALGTLVSGSTLAASKVFADESEFTSPVISRLAEKFNLNEDDVKAVFDAVREERRAQMQDRIKESKEERLDKAVEDGVITEGQRTALLEKWQEMQTERQAGRQQHKEEMQAWFTEQGIDQEALMQYGGSGFGGHKGMRGGPGPSFGELSAQADQE